MSTKDDLKGFSKFCNETTLHGLTYLNHKMSKVWKVFWIVFLCIIFCAATFVVKIETQKYIESTTVTTIKSTMQSLDDVTMPSVYICNSNVVTKSFLQTVGLLHDPAGFELVIDHFIKGFKADKSAFKGSNRTEMEIISNIEKVLTNGSTTRPFLFAASQICPDMIVFGKHSESGFSAEFIQAFEAVMDLGICCLVSPYLNFVNDETRNIDVNKLNGTYWLDPPKGALGGPGGNLKFLLDAEIFDSAYSSFDGFIIAFADQRDKPVIAQDGFLVSTGTYALASLDVTIVNTSESVMNRFDNDRRQCYTDEEFELKHFRREDGYQYSMKNCLYAAYYEKVLSNCSCIPETYYSLLDETLQLPLCKNDSLMCDQKWLSKIGSSEMSHATNTKNEIKNCYQRCERQSEHPTITTATFPAKETFTREKYYCLAMAKILRICSNKAKALIFESFYHEITCQEIEKATNLCKNFKPFDHNAIRNSTKLSHFLLKYAEQNFVLFKYFIKDPYYMLIIRDERISSISYLGNVGGLLGLCMGFSLVSIFELFYHTYNAIIGMFYKTTKVSRNEKVKICQHS